jgi:hypothetical protein
MRTPAFDRLRRNLDQPETAATLKPVLSAPRLALWIRTMGGLVVLAALLLAFVTPLGQTCHTVVPTDARELVDIFTVCYADPARRTLILTVGLIVGLSLLSAQAVTGK